MGLFRFVDFEHCIGIVLLTLLFAFAQFACSSHKNKAHIIHSSRQQRQQKLTLSLDADWPTLCILRVDFHLNDSVRETEAARSS